MQLLIAYVEINPEDAKEFGVKTRNKVRMVTKRGSLIVEAKVIDSQEKEQSSFLGIGPKA
ncbi:MAG: molybdopterin dinucleotide binding domain-containing protein [Melioribacteraceae bacterium]|nr:molybdopterin dinucleotide binding domain-containing protein [Melioribacteraceae bacterium]